MNKHLYLCHPLVLSSPTLMMHGHMNLKFGIYKFGNNTYPRLIRRRSNLGNIFSEKKSASYGPGNTIYIYIYIYIYFNMASSVWHLILPLHSTK